MRDQRMGSVWPVRGQCMASAWPVHGQCVASAWPVRGQCMASAWPVHGQCVASAWPVCGQCMASAWPVCRQCVTSAWPVRGWHMIRAMADSSPTRAMHGASRVHGPRMAHARGSRLCWAAAAHEEGRAQALLPIGSQGRARQPYAAVISSIKHRRSCFRFPCEHWRISPVAARPSVF